MGTWKRVTACPCSKYPWFTDVPFFVISSHPVSSHYYRNKASSGHPCLPWFIGLKLTLGKIFPFVINNGNLHLSSRLHISQLVSWWVFCCHFPNLFTLQPSDAWNNAWCSFHITKRRVHIGFLIQWRIYSKEPAIKSLSKEKLTEY